jgi:hypothetical protein
MSSEEDQIRAMTERIARRLAARGEAASSGSGEPGGEMAALRASLVDIQRRLAHIEAHLARAESHPVATAYARAPWSGGAPPQSPHPSQERFEIGEAVAELVDHFEREKMCELEPGGRPCDHCGMCSARGF